MRTAAIFALQVGLIFLVACGKKDPLPFGGAVTIELSSSIGTASLGPGVVTTITATVFDQSNQGVVWSIAPLNFGTLSTPSSTGQSVVSVTYTAPTNFASNTTVTITATSVSNPFVSSSIPVNVSPITVSLQFVSIGGTGVPGAAQTLDVGQQLGLIGIVLPQTVGSDLSVTWALSPTNAGSLTDQTASTVTYAAPTTVSSPVTATVTATSVANPAATASIQITVLPSGAAPNVAIVSVDGGPVPNQFYPNGAFTSVTICNPGSITSCQTVDGVLVDTGSYGLRILQSQIPRLKLPTLVDGLGNTLQNCVSLVDGSYLWGPVSTADIYIAGETTTLSLTPHIQVIRSSDVLVPNGCSNGGTTNLNTPQLLGANGILGIGPEPTDCTVAGVNYCDGSTQSTPPNLYYACPSVGCATTDSPVIVAALQQVTNPVTLLSDPVSGRRDNNGVVLQFPSVAGNTSSVLGTLTFGIGTQSNNQLGNAIVFDVDSSDHFTTVYNAQTLTSSFIDSGSNALYFPDPLPTCPVNTSFFCPSSLTDLSADVQGVTQGQATVNFAVDNADSLFSSNPDSTAFSTLAGPRGTYQACSDGNISCVFDWGMPFFYGRTVYTHVDACAAPPATCDPLNGAWWAY